MFLFTNRVVVEKIYPPHNGDQKHFVTNRVATFFFLITACLWISIIQLMMD
jgi:hypothetical protein